MEQPSLKYYLERYAQGVITAEERQVLAEMYHAPRYADELNTLLAIDEVYWREKQLELSEGYSRVENAIAQQVSAERHLSIPGSSPQRIGLLRRGWLRYASAIILVAGVATAIGIASVGYFREKRTEDVAMVPEIHPGTNRAVLLVDNKEIDLASAKTGIAVGKTITYSDGEKLSDAGSKLLLTTPNGGQYQLVLPDGTKAWLNAASSISFPSVFTGANRVIKVTGEVYLEVAKDKTRPFLVDIGSKSLVQVLGTSFNICAYSDDGKIKTTLIDGSIRVFPTGIIPAEIQAHNAGNNGVMLHPGEQAVQVVETSDNAASTYATDKHAGILVNTDVDLEQALAWKNGLFSFNNVDLRLAMKQLERWYDIKVEYEGTVPDINLDGEIYRNVSLSGVLEPLSKWGLKFKREGRVLKIRL